MVRSKESKPKTGQKNKKRKPQRKFFKQIKEASEIKNPQRRRMLVVRKKISRSKEGVLYKMEKRQMEKAGQVFEEFRPVTQEEKAFSIFRDEKKFDKEGRVEKVIPSKKVVNVLKTERGKSELEEEIELSYRESELMEGEEEIPELVEGEEDIPELMEPEKDEVDLEEDLKKEMENDEFTPFLNGEKTPKVFLTSMFKTPKRNSYLLLQGE